MMKLIIKNKRKNISVIRGFFSAYVIESFYLNNFIFIEFSFIKLSHFYFIYIYLLRGRFGFNFFTECVLICIICRNIFYSSKICIIE